MILHNLSRLLCLCCFALSQSHAFATNVKKQAIVVGGGPVGLATALTLSNAPHFYNVTLLEQTTGTGEYDPSKAFLYNINTRGQEWTSQFPAVQALLEERGLASTQFSVLIVPSDPKVPLPEKKVLRTSPSSSGPSYWIPRHAITVLLEEALVEQETKRRQGIINVGQVELLKCKQFESIQTTPDGCVEVTVLDTKDPNVRFRETFTGNLVVGADGKNSAVRHCLADESTTTKTSWLSFNPKQFRVKAYKSPATGLQLRVLQFPPGFEIPNGNEAPLKTDSDGFYAIRSAFTGPRNFLSLGVLPLKDTTSPRPINIIARPNHEVWTLKTGAQVKEWFSRSFPRFDFDTTISMEEWDRFASVQGTTFPHCQHSPKLQVSHPSGQAGVVLVGDSFHAFPPDLGQGINSGFGDVAALDRALQGKDITTGKDKGTNASSLGEALQEYERVRGPEIAALVKLARYGSPYQYRQPLRKDRVGRFLWTLNIALRMILNKCTGGLVPESAIAMATSNPKMTFRQVMRRADSTTFGLFAFSFGLCWKLFLGGLVGKLL